MGQAGNNSDGPPVTRTEDGRQWPVRCDDNVCTFRMQVSRRRACRWHIYLNPTKITDCSVQTSDGAAHKKYIWSG